LIFTYLTCELGCLRLGACTDCGHRHVLAACYIHGRICDRVNSGNLRSGDQVFFQRGGVWRDMLQPQPSGLYFGAYGTGSRPVISGADIIGNRFFSWWYQTASNVWSVSVNAAPTQLWFHGVLGTQVSTAAQVLAARQWSYV